MKMNIQLSRIQLWNDEVMPFIPGVDASDQYIVCCE